MPWEILWPWKYHFHPLLQCILDLIRLEYYCKKSISIFRSISWATSEISNTLKSDINILCDNINLKNQFLIVLMERIFAKFKVFLTKYKFSARMFIIQSWERTRKLFLPIYSRIVYWRLNLLRNRISLWWAIKLVSKRANG